MFPAAWGAIHGSAQAVQLNGGKSVLLLHLKA